MSFGADERGQAIQIGAVLLFGILIISLSTYQAFVVPNQNRGVEFNHNQQVQSQLQELRNAIVSSVSRSTGVSVSLDLGTTFPSRLVGLNPPPPSGTLETVGTTDPAVNLSVRNAVATDPETADYWSGDERNFTTGLLEYAPRYSEYDEAPVTVYDNTLLYNQFRNANRTVTGQRLVDGNRLTFVVLNGSLQENGPDAASVDVQPVSTPVEPTTVRNASGGNLSVSFPSRFPEKKWKETLEDEFDGAGSDDRYVTDVNGSSGPDGLYNITITFEADTYRMRLVKVGLGSGATEEPAAYLTELDGEGSSVQQGGSMEITLGVRDAYGNAVGNVAVNASAPAGGFADGDDRKFSDTDGEVTFIYEPGSASTGTKELKFSLRAIGGGFDRSTPENVTVNVSVTSSGGGGGGSSAYSVLWQNPEKDNDDTYLSGCSASDCTWDVGADSDSNLTLRVNTTPSIDGSNIDFAINNSTVGMVSPGDNLTGGEGSATTTLTAENDGTIGVYAASGGSSDVINVTVEDTGSGPTNQPPNAAFTYAPTDPTPGEAIQFDSTSSTDPEADTLTYEWDWTNDGTVDDTTTDPTTTITHAYANSGTYTVELTVRDGNGGVDSTTQSVSVTPAGFSSITASDLPRGSNGATQTLTFQLNKTLPDGETVTINLDNAQGIKGGQNKPDPVDYRSASVDTGSSSLSGGSASLSATSSTASVTYTANGDVSAGTSISIDVNGVETRNGNPGDIPVVFDRSDGVSESTIFILN
jgi:PKD repeat protein